MSDYFDTSAMIRAFRLNRAPTGLTRAHTLAEFYCVLTGPGLATLVKGKIEKVQFSPEKVAAAAKATFRNISYVKQTGEGTLNALDWAADKNVSGRSIHDWMHVDAATEAYAQHIITTNRKHFELITTTRLVDPDDYFTDHPD